MFYVRRSTIMSIRFLMRNPAVLFNTEPVINTTKFSRSVVSSYPHQKQDVDKNLVQAPSVMITPCRWKGNKKQEKKDVDSDDDSDDELANVEEEDWAAGSDSKVSTLSVPSLRTDLILKSSLGLARNKVETLFYDSKIRINGKKLLKKSSSIRVGDELDVIRGPSPENPSHFIIVSRIIVLGAVQKNEDRLSVRIRKYPKLVIEDEAATN